ncbi:MAG TPA: TPM domain-containing protein, partial [Caulobacteraceae bacterium]
ALALALPPIVLAVSLAPLTDFTGQLWLVGQMGALQSELGMAIGLYAAAQIVLFLVVLAIVHIPAVRRPLTPRALRRHRVANAAHRQFVSIGARAHSSETGVLIFVALEDRQVQILADAGIHQKCGETPWSRAANAITSAMKAGDDPTGGILEAVDICGQALRQHYPATGPHDPSLSPRPLEV